MKRFWFILVLLTALGCGKPAAPQDAQLQAEYDRSLQEHQGHTALRWYSGTEVCKVEGGYQGQPTLLAVYFKRQVLESQQSDAGNVAEALIWRDQAGTWHTSPWQATPHHLEEITVTAGFLKDGQPSGTFKEALDRLVDTRKQPLRQGK